MRRPEGRRLLHGAQRHGGKHFAPAIHAATLTTAPSAGHCLSRISWLRATPTRVFASHYSICEGAGRKLPVWCGTPHLALVARIRLGSGTFGAHTSSGIAQCSAPKQRAVGARRASAGGRAHSVRSSPSPFHSARTVVFYLGARAFERTAAIPGGLAPSPGPSLFLSPAGLAPAAPWLRRLRSAAGRSSAADAPRQFSVPTSARLVSRLLVAPAPCTAGRSASRCAVLAASSSLLTLVVCVSRCRGCRGFPQPARSGMCVGFLLHLGASACGLRLRSCGAPSVRRRFIAPAVRTAAHLLSRM